MKLKRSIYLKSNVTLSTTFVITVKLELSDVEQPLWRKKVDSSLFRQNGTTIPNWACKMWEIENDFSSCNSRNSRQSVVKVEFNGKQFKGWVTIA